MTTVAYRKGWMVSESRSCFKDRIDDDSSKKLFRLPDGSVMGGAGNSTGILQMLNVLKSLPKGGKKTLPNVNIRGTQILLAHKKKVYYYERGAWEEIRVPYYSIGTGSDYALAAMDADCSAEEAVKIAIKRDAHSGGRLQKMKV